MFPFLVNKVKSSQNSSRDGAEQIPPIKILLVGEGGKNSWVIIAKNITCETSTMVNFQSDAMSMVHFSTAMQYRLFLENLNIAIVAIIFLDHREQLFFNCFAHFRTDYFAIIH